MNDGMKIILERMKTHPEEFKDNNKPFAYLGKWIGLVSEYENNLPKEDMKAFKEAIDAMRQEEFTAKVMEELLDPKSEQLELDLNIKRTPPPRMQQAGQTLGAFTSSASLKELLAEKAELHALKNQHADIFKKPKKEHKTIFGKLFNYS
jgi:small-conductance mechanosensitive channel